MSLDKVHGKPLLVMSILGNRCPRCRRGKLFKSGNVYKLKGFMQMYESCTVCGQPLDMEPGFYYGTNLVSYALAILFSAVTFFGWWIFVGFSLTDHRFFWWMGVNAVLLVLLQPPMMRLSRTLWLTFFVPYSENWHKGDIIEPERLNREQRNNW